MLYGCSSASNSEVDVQNTSNQLRNKDLNVNAQISIERAKKNCGDLYLKDMAKEAYPFCKQAADSGVTSAEYILGGMYLHGFGVTENREQAIYWLRKAADKEDTDAQYSVGTALIRKFNEDKGTEDESSDGVNYLIYAAYGKPPHAQAAYTVAKLYYEGKLVPKNDMRGDVFMEVAAKLGHTNAAKYMSVIYGAGHGFNQNQNMAAIWCQVYIYKRPADNEYVETCKSAMNAIPSDSRELVFKTAKEYIEKYGLLNPRQFD